MSSSVVCLSSSGRSISLFLFERCRSIPEQRQTKRKAHVMPANRDGRAGWPRRGDDGPSAPLSPNHAIAQVPLRGLLAGRRCAEVLSVSARSRRPTAERPFLSAGCCCCCCWAGRAVPQWPACGPSPGPLTGTLRCNFLLGRLSFSFGGCRQRKPS